jgi:hypothetical protein
MPNILERENDKMNDKKETTPTATKCIRDNDGHRWRKQTTPWATPRSKGGSNTWTQHLRIFFYVVHPNKGSMTPLKFTTIGVEKTK